ncbi:hypothetical protein LOTGIDRAFT_176566 [Lottia gigantea]|uniref:Uncharacterized protein n=1 Tax=Lottia gigantea TaxID=225164 RepID=V4C512_LOTGI|nr:hypothetical protein LOTGIDRAFT_176566 [Lottia gigantea]ESO96679.1 hypothetical protein LOTGIDRAFT_176566 [Lottia gigantea]
MQDVVVPSFSAQYGFKNKLAAADVVYATASVLESIEKGKSPNDNFLNALDVLNRNNVSTLEKALEIAKKQLVAVVNQVQTFLDMHQVISAGPFLYSFIQEGIGDVKYRRHLNKGIGDVKYRRHLNKGIGDVKYRRHLNKGIGDVKYRRHLNKGMGDVKYRRHLNKGMGDVKYSRHLNKGIGDVKYRRHLNKGIGDVKYRRHLNKGIGDVKYRRHLNKVYINIIKY